MIIKDKQERAVVHLEMNGEHYYFGNLKSLTDNFGADVIGVNYNFLKNYNVGKHPFQNEKCTIRRGIIVTSKREIK